MPDAPRRSPPLAAASPSLSRNWRSQRGAGNAAAFATACQQRSATAARQRATRRAIGERWPQYAVEGDG